VGASDAPHFWQDFESGVSSLPQFAQYLEVVPATKTFVPHVGQNFESGETSFPQFAQYMKIV
jgi:hypothetical protein